MTTTDLHFGARAWIEGEYRYVLNRSWGDEYDDRWRFYDPSKRIAWVMLNPSTADDVTDDPTIRRCIGFSKRWGFGSLTVANLFARRCTRPVHLSDPGDPVGPRNDEVLRSVLTSCETVVAAWGAHKLARPRVRALLEMAVDAGVHLSCLGTTKDGAPRHPLYVRGDAELVRWP